ncbi:MAG: glycosyltransferase family 2 protein, partial [Planctomycetota bacterium]
MTISVILPTHAPCQRADALERAVASILGQSRPPGQLIVVHDGPGRVPPDLAGRAADAGIDYRYVRSDRPSLPRSRNTGVDAADGDIVVFGEDDLTFPPDYMQRVASLY